MKHQDFASPLTLVEFTSVLNKLFFGRRGGWNWYSRGRWELQPSCEVSFHICPLNRTTHDRVRGSVGIYRNVACLQNFSVIVTYYPKPHVRIHACEHLVAVHVSSTTLWTLLQSAADFAHFFIVLLRACLPVQAAVKLPTCELKFFFALHLQPWLFQVFS